MTVTNAQNTRDHMLERACEAFARHGFQAISLRDLATYIGIKAGSIYHHIESKQSLLYELMEDAISELLYRTRLSLRRQAQAHNRLDSFIDSFLAFKHHAPSRIHLLAREQISLTDDQSDEFNGLKDEYTQILSDIIKDLVKSTHLQPLALSMAADTVIGMLFSQTQWLNLDISEQQQSPLLKCFAHGIIAAIDISKLD